MPKIIWVLVSCNTKLEAERIGKALLQTRLAACYGIYPRIKSSYFWPPKSNRLETNKGPLLVLETLPNKYQATSKFIRKLHNDKVPFIGKVIIDEVNKDFYKWMSRELKNN